MLSSLLHHQGCRCHSWRCLGLGMAWSKSAFMHQLGAVCVSSHGLMVLLPQWIMVPNSSGSPILACLPMHSLNSTSRVDVCDLNNACLNIIHGSPSIITRCRVNVCCCATVGGRPNLGSSFGCWGWSKIAEGRT